MAVFLPTDKDDFISKYQEFSYKKVDRLKFKNKYDRKNIMDKIANDILSTI